MLIRAINLYGTTRLDFIMDALQKANLFISLPEGIIISYKICLENIFSIND